MKTVRHFLTVALLLAITTRVFALSTMVEVHPGQSDTGGFHFDIQALAPGDGVVRFHVVITRKQGDFTGSKIQLCKVIITEHSRGVHGLRDLPHQKSDQGLICDFTVPEKSLDDPDLCFVFTNFASDGMPSASFFYVKLKDAAKKP